MAGRAKFILIALISLFGIDLHAQGIPYQLNPPAPNARVQFCPVPDGGYPCPILTTVYSDSATTQVINQPISTGSSGNLSVYFAAGTSSVTVQLLGQGYGPQNRFVTAIGGGGSSGLPGTNALTAASSCNGGTVGHTGNCYFLYQDAKIVVGCTWTSGLPTITCPSGTFKSTDCKTGAGCTGPNDKTEFGTASCPGTNPPACVASIAEGIIASFISSTQITVSVNPTTNGTVGSGLTTSFQFGTDDTTNISTANTALLAIAQVNTGASASLAVSCGASMIQQSPFIYGQTNRMPLDVHGCGGEATILIPRQDFLYTGCGTNGGCIFEDDNSASGNTTPIGLTDYFHDFLIYGGGYDCNGCNLGGKSALYVSYAHHVENVTVQGWNWSTATPLAQRFTGIFNAGGRVVNSHAYNAGYSTCQTVNFGGVLNLISIWDRAICAPGSSGPGLDMESGTAFIVGSNFEPGSSGINSGAISQFGGTIISGGGNFLQGKVIVVQGNAHFNNDTFSSGNGGGVLLCGFNSSPAPNCYVRDSVSISPPQIPATGTTGPANLFDEGGNVWGGIPSVTTGTYIAPVPSPQGSCTGTSTASIGSPGIFVQPASAATRTCTSTTEVAVFQAPRAGTLQVLQCTATAGGVNASSGLVTVRVAPLATGTFAASGITATFGTTTSAIDTTHTLAVTTGQFVSIAYTTQVAETLAGVSCNVALQ